ncbi:MAG: c-type cytochrome [Bradymonadaceae bacterium]
MMKALNKKIVLFVLVVPALLLLSVSGAVLAEEGATEEVKKEVDYAKERGWKIPPPVKNIKNPLEATPANLQRGKVWYTQNCQSCHGASGKGDGSGSADLTSDPGDFSSAKFQSLTDGELLFMTNEGKDEMKAFKKELTPQQVWQTILYIRTMKE